MLIETFVAGPLGCNCTVLADEASKQAIVIDPGGETERIAEIIRSNGLTVASIIHTHAHLDHIFCTRDVKEAHGGEICLHEGDLFLYDGLEVQGRMFGLQPRGVLPVDRFLQHGEQLALGAARVDVIHTPGHTPGSTCFEVKTAERTVLFAGDTLFRGSIGRTDLPGGDGQLILKSIKERLYSRDLDTVVVTGHGPTTTLGDEMRKNPFVRA